MVDFSSRLKLCKNPSKKVFLYYCLKFFLLNQHKDIANFAAGVVLGFGVFYKVLIFRKFLGRLYCITNIIWLPENLKEYR